MGVCVRVMGGSGDVPLRLHRRVVSWLSVAADRRPARSVLTSGFVVLIPDLVRSEILPRKSEREKGGEGISARQLGFASFCLDSTGNSLIQVPSSYTLSHGISFFPRAPLPTRWAALAPSEVGHL